jgi:DNA invertase Pin-like site-specific DNA recombinase
MSPTLIAYYRVSTDGQGKSGLGLEAQREAVTRFAANEDLEVAGEFIEVAAAFSRRSTPQAGGGP